ncbi:MAG: NUDIX hydrolase [Actinomycetota bacterium]|nr:NUDIX hydrolase [Actinomycetota bacterium]
MKIAERAEIRAAGGVVIRANSGPAGGVQVVIVHRPRYDDWSLPKGKLDRGEGWAEGALREVREETGLRCELGEECGQVSYRDRRGRTKLVRFWLMRPLSGEFEPSDEVDEVAWIGIDQLDRLTYAHDRELAAAALRSPKLEDPRSPTGP